VVVDGALVNSTVGVRDARLDDLPALTDLYNHYVETTAITFDVKPFTVDTRRPWFDHYATTGPHRLLVATSAAGSTGTAGTAGGGEVLGYVTSSPFRPKAAYVTSVETSVYCRHDATGRGIGRRLYEGLFTALADEDLHWAYAAITLPNDASVRLHTRCGFTEIGIYHEVGRKNGRYWDTLWLERPLP
jgi:phosphinothricin acetyltransferase